MRQPKICERKRPNGKITYFAQIGTKQVGLGADPKRAKKLFVELLVKKDDASSPDPLVRQVIDRFLSWCIRNQAPATYRWYAQFLKSEIAGKTSFWNFVTSGLRVSNAIRCKFRRIQERLGIPDLCAYTLRHSWATRKLEAGVDSHVVAKLMGHVNTDMLQRYVHVDQKPDFMLAQLKRGD